MLTALSGADKIKNNKTDCSHSRMIDDVRDHDGKSTGHVQCIECGRVFEDPDRGTRQKLLT